MALENSEEEANEQTTYYFNVIQALWSTYGTRVQFLQDSNNDNSNNNNKNCKNYLHKGPCTQCEKMAHKDNLEISQDHFLRAPIIYIVRSHNYEGNLEWEAIE